MNMMMSGKEKLYFFLNRIEDVRIITPSGHFLVIDPVNNLNNNYTEIELIQLFTKLEKDERVLKVLKPPRRIKTFDFIESYDPYPYADDGCWHIKLLPAFGVYLLKIQQEPEYQKFTGIKPINETEIERLYRKISEVDEQIRIRREAFTKAQSSINDNPLYSEATRVGNLAKLEQQAQTDIGNFIKQKETFLTELSIRKAEAQPSKNPQIQVSTLNGKQIREATYEILYSEQSREILINGFLLKKLRSFSDNDAIFAYLYKNPKQDKSTEDIKKGTGLNSIKDLNKFVENIGFTGELRKVFFKVSKNTIRFNNPITKEDLRELGMEYLRLE